MAFIRVKNINGGEYAYLVESLNTNKGPRQKVKQYVGRIHRLEKKEGRGFEGTSNSKKDILCSLVLPELLARGFSKKKDKYQSGSLIFCPRECSLVKKNSKEAILALDEGYICSFTLQRLLSFKKSNDLNSDAVRLAKHFLEAGLAVSEENFVKFYEKLK